MRFLRSLAVSSFTSLVFGCVAGKVQSGDRAADSPGGLTVAEAPAPEPIQEALDPSAPEVSAAITVHLEQRHQTLEGFGAALAWHQGRLVGNVSEEVYELLFPELGLDILRFRNRHERSDRTDGNLAEEVYIFQQATRALGKPPRLMLSSWSPPAALKENGKERCNNNENCTLRKRDGKFVYDEFGDWWLRSFEHYETLGLRPDFVSLQNEPDFIPGDWEGCKFTPEESSQYPSYGKALAAVHSRFAQLSRRPRLLGPEVLGIHYHRIPEYLAGIDQTLLDGVAHHIYERGSDNVWDWRHPGPDSFLDEMAEVRSSTTLPTYQTEFNTDEDGGVDGGFETAWLIHHTMVTEHAVAFLYWDLIWPGNKGLVSLVGLQAKPRDHYYAVRHFARFTDPGYVRVHTSSDGPNDVSSLLSSAYVSPDGAQLTAVLLNTGTSVANVQLVYPSTFDTVEHSVVTTFRPGKSHRWISTPVEVDTTDSNSQLTLRLPARSTATLVLTR